MCITSLQAHLNDTAIGSWDIDHPKYGYRHVLAYENAPQNLGRKPNCMLLHIPAKVPILPEEFLELDWRKASPELLPFLPKYGDIEDLRGVPYP